MSYSTGNLILQIDTGALTGGSSAGNSYTIPSALTMTNTVPAGGQVSLEYQTGTKFSRTDGGISSRSKL